MNWTNALGSIAAVLTVVTGVLTGLGCAPGAVDFTATCSIPWLPPAWLPMFTLGAGAIFGLSTLIGKITRSSGGVLNSLFGSTAVVVSEAKADEMIAKLPNGASGVVTPDQVISRT